MEVETHTIPTKENGLADDLSRGRVRRFLTAVAELGFGDEAVVEVQVALEDLADLCRRFVDTTAAMPDRRTRSKDRYHAEVL